MIILQLINSTTCRPVCVGSFCSLYSRPPFSATHSHSVDQLTRLRWSPPEPRKSRARFGHRSATPKWWRPVDSASAVRSINTKRVRKNKSVFKDISVLNALISSWGSLEWCETDRRGEILQWYNDRFGQRASGWDVQRCVNRKVI